MPLIRLRKFLPVPSLLNVFIMKGFLNLFVIKISRGAGKSRFTVVTQINNIRINHVSHTTVNLLLPTPVFINQYSRLINKIFNQSTLIQFRF